MNVSLLLVIIICCGLLLSIISLNEKIRKIKRNRLDIYTEKFIVC